MGSRRNYHVSFRPVNELDYQCSEVKAETPMKAVDKVKLKEKPADVAVLRFSSSCPNCGQQTINQ